MAGMTGRVSLSGMTYRVIRTLGVGAGSTILLIAAEGTGSRYALKVVRRTTAADDVYVRQALHEYEVAQRLRHPNLIRIHDCRQKRSWFRRSGVELLMEYIDGPNLDDLEINDLGHLLDISIQVAAALGHMHRRGISHGDLKPSNILEARNGVVKVIDLGTAWVRGQPKDRVQGTPQYMAPEQATQKLVNERTDIYNLGATLYRLLTGQYANLGGVPSSIEGSAMHWARPRPPHQLNRLIPAPLSAVVMSCLESNPERRPTSARELKGSLLELAHQLGYSPREITTSEDGPD